MTRQGQSPASFRRKSSEVNLLITVSDHWLADRVRVLGALWRDNSGHGFLLIVFFFAKVK